MVTLFRIKLWALSLCLLTMMTIPFTTQASDALTLKASLAYNLAKFVTWPEQAEPKEYWQLCYFSETYDLSFEPLKNKKLLGKALHVKRVRDASEVGHCDIVYIGADNRHLLRRLFVALRKKPVLTISDGSGFIDQGGMIEVINMKGRLRFKVNRTEMKNSKILMSSKALKLAIEVK